MKLLHYGIPSLALFLIWLVLSGHYDVFHISLGAFSTFVVITASRKLFQYPQQATQTGIDTRILFRINWLNALRYPFTLFLNILIANLKVAALILDPRLPIDPMLLKFDTTFKTDAAKILLGNSITLTPGTITLDIEQQTFYVHALSPALAESLLTGSDQNRVAKIFGDTRKDQPDVQIRRHALWPSQ